MLLTLNERLELNPAKRLETHNNVNFVLTVSAAKNLAVSS